MKFEIGDFVKRKYLRGGNYDRGQIIEIEIIPNGINGGNLVTIKTDFGEHCDYAYVFEIDVSKTRESKIDSLLADIV